jgi:hypothetical protein
VAAFWQAVQGRYAEAAEALPAGEPVPDNWTPPVMGGDNNYGLFETARARIYRQTGREAEAGLMVKGLLGLLRSQSKSVGAGCALDGDVYDGWMRHASLAADQGLKDEAVAALQGAMRCGYLPPAFQPQLPWFRQLDGYPPYEALKREREQRVERARAELIKIETDSGLAAGQ